jgi:hypothetical protein
VSQVARRSQSEAPGTDVVIFKIFSPKKSAKKYFRQKISEKVAFCPRNKAKLCKSLIRALLFEKSANYFAEKCRKSQKIVIITSTQEMIDHGIRQRQFSSF